MNLAEILDELTVWIEKYTVLPTEHVAPTLALWMAHTWVSPAFYTTPRLVLSSPVPGSGKTRVLELLNLVCFDPKMTISSSTAALFRRIGLAHRNGQIPPTVLFDEIDAVFGASRPSEQTEQLRSLMNSGYKRGATVDRCEGDASKMEVIEWPVFSPLALAGLAGRLPETITTRAIVIEMRKRAAGEHVAPYRERDARAEVISIVEALKAWAEDAIRPLETVQPVLPAGVEDRPAEVWEPLLAVADMAGERWPDAARSACLSFVFAPSHRPLPLGVELLRDIREVMGHGEDTTHRKVDRIKTTDLLAMLKNLDDAPWAGLDGGGIASRRLSQLLAEYSVAPVPARINGVTERGYLLAGNAKQAGLADAWSRYLPPTSSESVTRDTAVTSQVDGAESVTLPEGVTVASSGPVTRNGPLTSGVTEVTEVTGFPSREPGELSNDESTVLGALHPLCAFSTWTVAGSIPHLDRSDVESILVSLMSRGLVTKDQRDCYRLVSDDPEGGDGE